jgi:hypothetical protein
LLIHPQASRGKPRYREELETVLDRNKLILIMINYGGPERLAKQDFCHVTLRQSRIDFPGSAAAPTSTEVQDFPLMRPIFTILNSV